MKKQLLNSFLLFIVLVTVIHVNVASMPAQQKSQSLEAPGVGADSQQSQQPAEQTKQKMQDIEWQIGKSIKVDEDGTVSYLRSRYRYLSANSRYYELQVLTIPTGYTVTIYLPATAETIVVQPAVGYSVSGTTITISSTQVEEYLVSWLESSDSYLAIDDQSSDYLTDVGFETGTYTDDWENWDDAPYSSLTINSTVVSEGAFSLRLADSDTADDVIFLNPLLPNGYYYVAFDYYIESITNTLYFSFYNGSWESQTLDSTTNRWQTFYAFIQINGYHNYLGDQRNLLIWGDNWQGIFFVDNFRLYQPNARISTIAYQEYELAGIVRIWDNCNNSGVSNTNVSIQIRVRANNTLIYEQDDLKTNAAGLFSLLLSAADFSPAELEYTLNITSYVSSACESYVTPVSVVNPYIYRRTFSTNTLEGYNDYSGASSIVTDGYVNVSTSTTWDGLYHQFDSPITVPADSVLRLRMRKHYDATFSVAFYDTNDTTNYYKTFTFDSPNWTLKTFTIDSQLEVDEIKIFCINDPTSDSSYARVFDLDFIEICINDTPVLHEMHNYYYLTSINNTYSYYTTLDSSLIDPDLHDLELLPKDSSAGQHTLSYIVFSRTDEQLCFLPSEIFSVSYTTTYLSTQNLSISTSDELAANSEFTLDISFDQQCSGATYQLLFFDQFNRSLGTLDSGTIVFDSNNQSLLAIDGLPTGNYYLQLIVTYDDQTYLSNYLAIRVSVVDPTEDVRFSNIFSVASILLTLIVAIAIVYFIVERVKY